MKGTREQFSLCTDPPFFLRGGGEGLYTGYFMFYFNNSKPHFLTRRLMSPNKGKAAACGCHCPGSWLCACVRYWPGRLALSLSHIFCAEYQLNKKPQVISGGGGGVVLTPCTLSPDPPLGKSVISLCTEQVLN